MSDDLGLTPSSGNIFADLGLSDPDLLLAKAELAITITSVMREQGLSEAAAARKLGVHRAEITAITSGRLDEFSLERLIALVRRLGQDVQITVTANPEPLREGRMVARRHENALVASSVTSQPERVRFD